MLYVMYIADVKADKLNEYYDLMGKFRTQSEKHGVKYIGAWRTAVGKREEVTILEAYKNMGDFETVRAKIEEDPICRELILKLCQIRTVTSKFLTPVPFSPLV